MMGTDHAFWLRPGIFGNLDLKKTPLRLRICSGKAAKPARKKGHPVYWA